MTSHVYKIRVIGSLGPATREAFADMLVETEQTVTLLSGHLDQPGLHNVLDRVRKKPSVDRRRAFDDLLDVEALFVARGDHNHVLNRVQARIIRTACGKNIGLRKNLTLGPNKSAGDPSGGTGHRTN